MVAEPNRKNPLGRPKRRWDIDAGFIEIIWEWSGQQKFGSEQGEAAICANTDISFRFPHNAGNVSIVEGILVSEEELCYTELFS
jgi:hypothetical protein